LEQVAHLKEVPEGLAEVGITDAEQLVAVAAIDDVSKHLAQHLGRSKEDLDALIRETKKALPPPVVELIERPQPRRFALGALEPTDQMKAAAAALPMAAELEAVALPSAVNLIPRMSPIRNQSQRGTCVAFTVTAIHEYWNRVQGAPRDFSEQHLYY